MWRIVRILVLLAVIVAFGVIAFAYVGPWMFPAEFAAPRHEVTLPVTLELD